MSTKWILVREYCNKCSSPAPSTLATMSKCRSNIVECYKSNDSFDKVERCFDVVAGVGRVCSTGLRKWILKFCRFLIVDIAMIDASSYVNPPITSSSSDLPLCSSLTHSLFHSRLKTYLFHKSYSLLVIVNPSFHFFSPDCIHGLLPAPFLLANRFLFLGGICKSTPLPTYWPSLVEIPWLVFHLCWRKKK